MSAIISNLREKFPHNSTYIVGNKSLEVCPSIHLNNDWAYNAIGTLAPGQTVSIESTIILPDPLFPDWWVWGTLSNSGIPKYICLRKPMKNLAPIEYVYLSKESRKYDYISVDLIVLKDLMQSTIAQIDTLTSKTPSLD
jgi:hypothetical protein